MEEDINVRIERHLIVAGVRGQAPLLKGRLYGTIDVPNSAWQLEPHQSRLSARERTLSGTSSASTQSSFAVVTDPEISSSFAASLENGLTSDVDDLDFSSPALSSPVSSSVDENHHFPSASASASRRRQRYAYQPVSPQRAGPSASVASSYSSVESLHTGATRLLTLHLEKAESMIWPSLVVGPVPEALSSTDVSLYPWEASSASEAKYNMDPTSLVLIGLDLSDIRENKSEAFEYFVRAWHQAHVPSATVRLAAHYLPLTTSLPELSSPSSTPSASPCPTPTSSSVTSSSLPLSGESVDPCYLRHGCILFALCGRIFIPRAAVFGDRTFVPRRNSH
ncbi:hypothetical protein QCA50_005892 [Cerrena zonata]|uniref:Uncharacterized protein n=1 Tax=Cerrena zonata TaxID=2478898 RepID=A0AAW0GLI7_9APHY